MSEDLKMLLGHLLSTAIAIIALIVMLQIPNICQYIHYRWHCRKQKKKENEINKQLNKD